MWYTYIWITRYSTQCLVQYNIILVQYIHCRWRTRKNFPSYDRVINFLPRNVKEFSRIFSFLFALRIRVRVVINAYIHVYILEGEGDVWILEDKRNIKVYLLNYKQSEVSVLLSVTTIVTCHHLFLYVYISPAILIQRKSSATDRSKIQ